MIKKLHIANYKLFEAFTLECNDELNIIVGDNEAGKSTILEAINLGLSRKLNGRFIDTELSTYLFNKRCADAYVEAVQAGHNPALPKISIELYFADEPELQSLRGTNNSEGADTVGVRLEIAFDEDYREEYEELLKTPKEISMIPIEYYKPYWYSFANNQVTARSLQVRLSHIDASTIRLQSGTDHYLQNIINDGLEPKERVGLAVAYRKLKELFSIQPAIEGINKKLTDRKDAITEKDLSVAIDLSQKGAWETSLTPHLNGIPFQHIGKGDQSALKIMLALERQAEEAHVVLIEEPENHLSFTTMNSLIGKIESRCKGKQIFATTHSAYVLNKLGMENVVLLHDRKASFLKSLPADTQAYFRKLSGYDTLRLILAKRTILVEGPSDELIVQKAYLQKHGKLPIKDGIDVISVRGLAFKRFLDIAKELGVSVDVVTDNDGDHAKKVVDKYKAYAACKSIRIFADVDDTLVTLEAHLLASNNRNAFNTIFGKTFAGDAELLEHMKDNKTDCALALFDTSETIVIPDYINAAVA